MWSVTAGWPETGTHERPVRRMWDLLPDGWRTSILLFREQTISLRDFHHFLLTTQNSSHKWCDLLITQLNNWWSWVVLLWRTWPERDPNVTRCSIYRADEEEWSSVRLTVVQWCSCWICWNYKHTKVKSTLQISTGQTCRWAGLTCVCTCGIHCHGN